jgi:hypothetical protein
MADKANAIKNDLNRRAREVGIFDQELTLADLAAVRSFYDFTCLKCGKRPATSIDHVKALSEGGQNTVENLQLLCTNDNKAKGKREEDYRKGRILTAEFVRDNLDNSDNFDEESEDYSYETGENEESLSIAKRSNNGNHGIKGRSGRKPLEATILKRRLVEDKVEEAEASFSYLCAVRDNPFEPSAQRLAAAEMILDRVLGKATERSVQQKQVLIRVIREQRDIVGPAGIALGTGSD